MSDIRLERIEGKIDNLQVTMTNHLTGEHVQLNTRMGLMTRKLDFIQEEMTKYHLKKITYAAAVISGMFVAAFKLIEVMGF